MANQTEEFARYLEENGWRLEYVAENDLRWIDPVTGRGYARFRPALKIQMNRRLNETINAVLRVRRLEELVRVAWKLWDSLQWCDSEMTVAMAALSEEVTP